MNPEQQLQQNMQPPQTPLAGAGQTMPMAGGTQAARREAALQSAAIPQPTVPQMQAPGQPMQQMQQMPQQPVQQAPQMNLQQAQQQAAVQRGVQMPTPTQLSPQQVQARQQQQAARPQAQPQPAKKAKGAKRPPSTQGNLMISELRDGVVIMKDGSFRAVVACKSINFDLMSEQEREAVEYSYQNFINSLTFTTQILIRSQRIDIAPYLERLGEIRRNTDNMLLGVLMDDYINFIDILSQEANIMDKSFFVVIPYYTSADAEKMVEQTRNFFKSFSGKKGPEVTKIDRTTYETALTEINKRVDAIISGLFQIGIHSVRLNTRELSELFYNFNNPDTAVREPFVDFSKMAQTYVRKGEKGAENA